MSQVRITLDPYRLLLADGTGISVNSPADYVSACAQIGQAIRSKASTILEVRIYDTIAGEWLKEWASKYGEVVEIRTYRAYDALKERWGIDIPPLSDSEIIRSGLLDEKVTPYEGQSFESLVLEHFYHPFFAYPAFPEHKLAEFLNQAEKIDWKKNVGRPIVARIFRERLEQWLAKEKSQTNQKLIAEVQKDWQGLRQALGAYKLLRNYPEALGEKTLGVNFALLRRAQLETEALTIDGLDLNDVRIQVEYHLTAVREKIQHPAEFATVLDQMSGHLLEEFNFVEEFLKTHADWVSLELVRLVERRFSPIRTGIASRLLRLRRLVAVPRPLAPQSEWDAPRWLEWIANAYMPYHRWLETQSKYDEELAKYASGFADWYYEQFIGLKNSAPETFSFAALYNERNVILDEHRIALVILLDNLNYGFFPELRRLFNQAGISLTAEKPTFSLIPTATEIGKAALVAVTGDLTDLSTRDYSKLVAETWGAILKPRNQSAGYLANIGELQKLTRCEHKVYFLNYLPVDSILHESSQTYGQDHETRIHDALKVLVNSIVEFSQRFKIEKKLVVYVTSDHGSTRIARQTVNVLDKKYFKGISDIQHHRYVSISDEQLAQIPQVVESQCYVIDRKKYKTFQNYLAARQYYRFAETDQDFYVHGGLTPEEVVVPFARFEFTPVEVLALTLDLRKKEFRYAVKSTVEFEIGNPNAFPLENLTARLAGYSTNEAFIEALPSKKPTVISFQVVFRREPGAGNTRDLVVHIHYESQERSFDFKSNPFTINLKSVQETQDDGF